MSTRDPLVRAAIQALDAFGAIHRLQVLILLPLWARYNQLTIRQFDQVVSAFPPPPGEPDVLGTEPDPDADTGWDYSREPEPPPSGEPPGDEVLGLALNGRHATLDIPLPRGAAA